MCFNVDQNYNIIFIGLAIYFTSNMLLKQIGHVASHMYEYCTYSDTREKTKLLMRLPKRTVQQYDNLTVFYVSHMIVAWSPR